MNSFCTQVSILISHRPAKSASTDGLKLNPSLCPPGVLKTPDLIPAGELARLAR